jgi:sterol desaturase/sphingolipid hydroxylase (fatty acid hydroxylase superfamily)
MEYYFAMIMERMPETLSEFALQIFLGLLLVFIATSLFEYFVHRYIMHKELRIESPVGTISLFSEHHHRHAALHHGKYYRLFNHEEDEWGREQSIAFRPRETFYFEMAILPATLCMALLSPIIALLVLLTPPVHNYLWNTVHREMHQPRGARWSRWPVYRFLARYHYLHHRHTNANYNVVAPFADLVFGTTAMASPEDIIEMKRMGLL